MARYKYRDYLYESDIKWDGKNWTAAVAIGRDHAGTWLTQKRFKSERICETRLEAIAESAALAMRIIDGLMSGTEEL